MFDPYLSTDIEIVMESDGGEYLSLRAELGSYRQGLLATLDSRYMVSGEFPDIHMTERSHLLDLTSLIYNDGLAADKLRLMSDAKDVNLRYALIHSVAGRFGPYGRAILGSVPIVADAGLLSLSNSNLGSGKVMYRALLQFEAAQATGEALAATPQTLLVNLRDEGTATAITASVDIGGTPYEASIDVSRPNLSEVTLEDSSSNAVPASNPAGSLTITTTPADAEFELDIGV